MAQESRTLRDLVDEVRSGLVCDRCGKYVGSLATKRYLPPPYPVALDRITADQEVEALLGFELHMIGRMRQGNFVIRHPEREGRCVTVRDWVEHADEDEGEDADADVGAAEA
jgi:hypothetical protein